jgi:serine/threonine protein kinase
MGLDAMLDTLTPIAPTPVAHVLAKLRSRKARGICNEKDLNDVGFAVLRYFVAVATSVARIPPSDVLRFSAEGRTLCGLDSFPTVVRQLRLAEAHLPVLVERGILPPDCTKQTLTSAVSAWWSSRASDFHALTSGADPKHLVKVLRLLHGLLRLEVWVPHSLHSRPAARDRLERVLAYDRYRGPSAPEPSKRTVRVPHGAEAIQRGCPHIVFPVQHDAIVLTPLYPYLFLGGPAGSATMDVARGPKSLYLLVPPSERDHAARSASGLSGYGPEEIEKDLAVYTVNEEPGERVSWNTLCEFRTFVEPETFPLTIFADKHLSPEVRGIVESAWSLDTDAWIGRGSFGSVYRAKSKHKDFKGRHFAVKILDPGVMPRPGFSESINRFAHSSWHAPERLVQYYPQLSRLPPDSERPFWVAMEFVGTADGRAAPRLETWLASQSKYDGLALCHQLVKAVASLHRASVAHRDLHPANILVREDDDGSPQLVVVDLGLARFALAAPASAHASTLLPGIGRPPFAAPEQRFGGARTRPFALDVHALGWLCVMVLGGFGCEVLADRPHACLDQIERGQDFRGANHEAKSTFPAVAQMLRSWVHEKPEMRPESALDALDQWKATAQHKPTLFPGRTLSNGARIVSSFRVDTLEDHSIAWCVGNPSEDPLLALFAARTPHSPVDERFLEAWDRVSAQSQSLCAKSLCEQSRSGDLVVVRTPNRPLRPLFSRDGHPTLTRDMPLSARCRMVIGLLDLGVAMAATGGALAIDQRYVTADSLGWPFVLRPSRIGRAHAWVDALLESLFPTSESPEEPGAIRTETMVAGSSPSGTFVLHESVGLRATARDPGAWTSEEGFLAFAAGRMGWRERRDVTTTLGLAVRTLRSIARVFEGVDVILPDGVSELAEHLRDALVPRVRNPRSMGLPFYVARVRSQKLEALHEAHEMERADFVSQRKTQTRLEHDEREALWRADHEREQERARRDFEAEEQIKEANDPDYLPMPFEEKRFVPAEPPTPNLEFDSFTDWIHKRGYTWESDLAIGQYSPQEENEIVTLTSSRIELICRGSIRRQRLRRRRRFRTTHSESMGVCKESGP